MKFSLRGVRNLHSPVVVAGRTYIIKKSHTYERATATFTSPRGARIDLEFAAYEDGTSWIWPNVDGAKIRHPDHVAFGDTADLPEPLRPLVEQAIRDLEAEELRTDPTKRHAKSQALTATSKVDIAKADAALKRL
jgi:hypothetical protein